jgi:CHAD domain-containing protein
MKGEKVKHTVAGKVKKLGTLCFKVGERFDQTVIHDFRVDVKKLRSLLRLLKRNDDKGHKLPRKFMKLYRIAGGIRECQLELGRIAEAGEHLPLYCAKLKSDMKTMKKQWSEAFSEKAVRKFSDRLVHDNYDSLAPAALAAFIEDRLSIIKERLHESQLSDKHMHDVRKRIKDVLYVLKFAKNDWPQAHEQVSAISIESLDHLANTMGDYNDATVLMGRLRDFESETDDIAEKHTIENILAETSERLAKEKVIISDTVRSQVLSPVEAA